VFRFTLSSLLFQINLKHLLFISFLYVSGTTQALATYVNIGTIKDLIIKIFPWGRGETSASDHPLKINM
jgi:polyferredoxin